MQAQTGVINPYALGEMIAGRTIDWNSLPNPQKRLAEILHVSEKDIFDIKKPILNPALVIDAKGKITHLDETKAKARLQEFLKTHAKAQGTKLPPGLPHIPLDTIRNMHTLVHSAALELGTSEETLNSKVKKTAKTVAETRPRTGHGQAWKPADRKWLDKGDYFEDLDEFSDPVQGVLGDCYLIAAMSSVAWARPYAIVNMVRPSRQDDDHSPIHEFRFHKDGNGSGQQIEVTELTPVDKNTGNWVYARSSDAGEIWPAVMEKAYAKWKTHNTTDYPNYPSIAGGDPVRACAELVGGDCHYLGSSSHSGDDLWDLVRQNSLSMRTVNPMVAWTYPHAPAGLDYAAAHVVANHAYSILGWDYRNGRKYIVARNPWYTHHATLDTLSGYWGAYDQSFWERIQLNTHGVFAMLADTFQKYYAGIGVVR